jgi:replication factor C subunit 2/4
MKERLTAIARAEGMGEETIDETQLDAILTVSGGDMRRAVTSLQSVQALLAGGGNNNNDRQLVVDEAVISELAGLPPNSVVDTLYQSLLSNQFDTMQRAVQDVIAEGYSVQTLLSKLLDKFIRAEDDLDELGRARLAIRIAEAEDRMNDGADEYLQLMTVCGLALQCIASAKNKMKQ